MKMKNILVPVDGSELSKKSLAQAVEIAKKFNASITVLNVYEVPIPITGYEYNFFDMEKIEEILKSSSQQVLDDVCKPFNNSGIILDKLILSGHSGYLITETAEKKSSDLIIMGSRGLSLMKSLLLGSTSNYVVHHTKIPVLLVY